MVARWQPLTAHHVRVEIPDHGRSAEMGGEKDRKIAAYCRRLLADAARAAIRSASANRLHPLLRRGGAPGKGGDRHLRRAVGESVVDELEVLQGPERGERERGAAHRGAYSRKPPCGVTLNPPWDGQECLESVTSQVRITELCRAAFRVSATSAKVVASLVVGTIC
jgi:hypothetical protein